MDRIMQEEKRRFNRLVFGGPQRGTGQTGLNLKLLGVENLKYKGDA
jgi:hypothetical protein